MKNAGTICDPSHVIAADDTSIGSRLLVEADCHGLNFYDFRNPVLAIPPTCATMFPHVRT